MKPAKKPSRSLGLALTLLTVAALLATTLIPALAAHTASLPGSNFEIDKDANLKNDHAPLDWGNVSEDRQADKPSGQNDDSFGNGTKEDTLVPSIVSGSIPPNKSDLLNFGVYLEKADSGNFLHLFWHRVQEPTGTTNMDFELNQSKTLASNGVTPVRTAGDMLIQYDLAQGGVNPKLSVSKWVATGPKSQCEAANSTPCWGKKQDLSTAGDATGSINASAIPAAESDGLGDVSPRTFGEATVDFDELIGNAMDCVTFGSAYLKSRASDSFTAAVKDFIAPKGVNVTNCGSLRIVKQDDAGRLLAGAKFKVYKDDGDGIFEPGTGDVQVGSECTTTSDGTGNCTFSNLLVGQKLWVHETQAPPGYEIVGPNPVLREITSTSLHTVIATNRLAVGNLTVIKRNDAGSLIPAGVQFTLKGTSNSGVQVDLTCTTDAAGVCRFQSVPVGTYQLDEVAASLPAGYGKDPTLPRSETITSGATTSANVSNPRLHRVVVIVCHEGDDTLLARDVVLDGTTKRSIASVPGTLPSATQKDLCDLGGASFGGLGHGEKSLTAKIDQH